MSSLPNNILTQVQTYQESSLAYLQNYGCFVHTANTKFKDFQNLTANLGTTVTFDKPLRGTTVNSLVAQFQPTVQRVQNLTVNQQISYSVDFSVQQFVYNVREYMEQIGKGAVEEIASVVEGNIALNAISGVVGTDPNSPNYGTPDSNSGPFRFYGDGVTPINSFAQLSQMLANFRNFGAPRGNCKVYLPDIVVPQIVNNGLNQFVMDRNEEMAHSWMVGNWMGVDYYQSNLLPIHTAGNVGNNNTTLTLVSTNDPTGNNITQLTFSNATPNDINAIFYGDLFQFQDGVAGQPNLRFLTFVGHIPCAQPVQFRATAAAKADGSGNVVVNINPALCWVNGNQNQNLNNQLVAGMQVKVLPSHLAGLITSGNALYLAMPTLPEEVPYPTGNKSDEDTGVSMRMYYGSLFGQNQRGMVHDGIWGSTLVSEYSMRVAFPLIQ